MMNDRYCIFLLTVLLMAASVAYAASPVPPQMPQDPALSSGVLPNGIAYYIVANPSEKGMAEFAFVRRMAVPDSLRGRAVYDARYSVTDIPRFSPATVRDYAARYGASSAMCRRSVPVHVRVTDDSAVYRFGTFPVSGGNVTDSTLLLVFSIAEGQDTDVPAQDAIIVAGDVDRDAVLSRMRLLSLVVPSRPEEVPEDTSYVWKDRDTIICNVKTDTAAAVARISIGYLSPRTPREYMGTAVPVVSQHLTGILDRILCRRVETEMKRRGIPIADLRCRYAGSASGGGDEKYVISLSTDNSMTGQALEVLAEVLADADVNGVREKEYAGARNEYLVRQYRMALDPVTCNGRYVDECISSFLYGSAVVSKMDRFRFLVRGELPDSTGARLFNNFASELLDSTRNLTVSVTVADSARMTPDETAAIFRRAWERAAMNDTLTSYTVNLSDSLGLAEIPAEKLKVGRTVKEPVSGGTMWTFSNGMKVVYKRMQTGGIFYYDMMIRGGYSVVDDLRRGEGAFFSDILGTYDIAGLRSGDFHDLMLSEGITMSGEVTLSHLSLSGMAPRPSLTLLFKCLKSVANERSVNRETFAYYAACERLRLRARAGTMPARKAAIDSLMCPSYHYSSDKSPENLHPDACDRAAGLFDSHFSRADDGILMIVGDMEETAMKRFLQKNLSGFRTEPLAVARIRLPYQPISGWTTHIVSGKRQSLDLALSAPLQFSAENYMAMKVAAAALESALNRKLCGSAASARVFSEFSGYPQERVSFLISVSDLDPSVLPLDEIRKDPLVLLYDVRSVLSSMSLSAIPDDRISVCRDLVRNGMASMQNDPWYWVDMVKTRYTDGKDLNTKYAEKVDSVSPEKVMELISMLASGSRVEYVVR